MSRCFTAIYDQELARPVAERGALSERLKPLLERLFHAVTPKEADPNAIRAALIGLLEFLVTPEGRTDAHCRFVDRFVCLHIYPKGDWASLPEGYEAVVFDLGGQLHDTITAPEIARNFQSLPEQLLARARALPV